MNVLRNALRNALHRTNFGRSGGLPQRFTVRPVAPALLAALLTVAGLGSLWSAPPPVDRQWAVIWELVAGIGIVCTGLTVTTRQRTSLPGRLFVLAGILLLTGPPLASLGHPAAADLLTVLGAAGVIPVALLRIVPEGRARPARRALEAVTAVAGSACALASMARAPAAAVAAGLVVGVTVFCAGWLLFEITTGDARRQVLWMVLGVCLGVLPGTMIIMALGAVPPGATVLVSLLSLALPLAAGIALLAPRAVDVRAVIGQLVVVTLMVIVSVAAFRGAEAGSTLLSGRAPGDGLRSLFALGIAASFHPTLLRVRSLVDELLFGGRADPVNTLTRLGVHLTSGSAPQDWLDTLREALAVAGVQLRQGAEVIAVSGIIDPSRTEVTALRTGGEHVGDLVVGLSTDQLQLAPGTRAVLELVAASLAQALHAVRLTEQLQTSRERVVTALEEERRRVRRDLHDGLGPTLTGIAYSADAALNLVRGGPDDAGHAAVVLQDLRSDAGEAIAEVRRIVYGLRPKALDELGLIGAVTQRVSHLRAADGVMLAVTVSAPARLPDLPAAVEVAAYRVAVEGVTNVARHAGVHAAQVRFSVRDDGVLEVQVQDTGPSTAPWATGVGTDSMRERVESIGGSLTISTGPDGATVSAELPLDVPRNP